MMEKFIGKKEKRTNKGTESHIIHTEYNLSYLMFVSNVKILDQAVPEKSLTKKKMLTDRQTDILTEKAKKNLHTSFTGPRDYNCTLTLR